MSIVRGLVNIDLLTVAVFFLCQLVHCSCSMIKLTLPYIPGYLAFREGPFIKNEIDLLRKEKPGLMPQVTRASKGDSCLSSNL